MTRMLKASTIIFNKLIGKSQQECSWINCFSYSERHKRSVALTTRWIILHLSQKRHKYLSQHPKLFSSLHLILCLHAHLPKSLTKKLTTNSKWWGPSWLWGVGGGGGCDNFSCGPSSHNDVFMPHVFPLSASALALSCIWNTVLKTLSCLPSYHSASTMLMTLYLSRHTSSTGLPCFIVFTDTTFNLH